MDAPVSDGLPVARRRWAVTALAAATLMSMMDQSTANVALPTIARGLHTSAAASIWVINAYQLTVMVGVIPISSLGDIFGHTRVYRTGLAVFIVASLAGALSSTLLTLTLARVVAGLGAAALTTSVGALSRHTYPHAMLGRATANNAMFVALGAAAGPIAAGAILSFAPWPWLFAINVPFGIAALALSLRSLPQISGSRHRFDWQSALLSAVTFGLGIIALDGIAHNGRPRLIALELAIALVVGIVFVRRQARLAMPMFAVDLLARPVISLAAFSCLLSFVAQTIAYVALPFLFQNVLGRTPLQTGLLLLPWLLAAAAMAPLSGRLVERYDAEILGAAGLGVFFAGLALLTLLPAHPSNLDILWRMTLCGIGYGFFQAPNNRTIQGSAPRERSGASQGIQAVARLVGQTLGAVAVAIAFGVTPVSAHSARADEHSVTIALIVATISAAVAAIACLVRRGIPRSARAHPVSS